VLLGLSNTDLKEMGIRALGARKRILKKTKDKTGFCHFLSFRRAFLKARLLMSAAMGCPAQGGLCFACTALPFLCHKKLSTS
jgi:hypothetical protein